MSKPPKIRTHTRYPAHDPRSRLMYTAEQTAALRELLDRRYALGIAKAEYVGQVLRVDGTIDANLDATRTAITRRSTEASKAEAAARKLAQATPTVEHINALSAASQAALLALAMIPDFERHVEAGRFLFITDEHELPAIYFQCATPDNPDLPPLAQEPT